MKIVLTKKAQKDLLKLPKDIQQRIYEKVLVWSAEENLLVHAVRMVGVEPIQYRFRIGDYRVIGTIMGEDFAILHMGHRKDVYR